MGKHEPPKPKRWWRWWPVAGVAAVAAAGGYAVPHADTAETRVVPTPADTASTPKVVLPLTPTPTFMPPSTPFTAPTTHKAKAAHKAKARRKAPRHSAPPVVHKAPPPTHRTPPPTHRPPAPPPVHSGGVAALVAYLKAQVGKPYVFGAEGPNAFDCSGLAQTAFARIGVHLPRTSEQQSLAGNRVGLDELKPGDLLFWGPPGVASHSAVYIGNGEYIAAENPRVGVVRYSISFYRPDYGRRVI